MRTLLPLLGIAAGPMAMAGIGLTHPGSLTPATAAHWTMMHTALVPFFPLIGINLAWLVAGLPGVLPWLVRLAAFGYAVCYPAVDLLAGVAAGRLVELGQDPFAPTVSAMFDRGNAVGDIGIGALLVGSVLALVALFPSLRWRVVPGGVLLLIGVFLFGENHIYRPWGVLAMVVLALAFVALLRARQVTALEAGLRRRRAHGDQPAAPTA